MTNEPRRAQRVLVTLVTSASLFLLTVLTRVPFRTQVLYHWDSVNFAFAMRHFDVAADQPQPPGYILYVWLCRLVDLLFRDANVTMVWISVVASGLAVVFLYLLGRAMGGHRVGLVAALFLASSPLFWFYGEIALPHVLDTAMVLLSAWLLWRVREGERRLLWPAVIVLGIAGGIRPQTLAFLLPLVLCATVRVGIVHLLAAGLVGAVVCLAWFLPLTASVGGVGRYLEVMSAFSGRFQQTTSVLMGAGWRGVVYNLRKLLLYTLYGGAAAWLPPLLLPLSRFFRRPRPPIHWSLSHWPFILFWSVPALLFYTFIHMGQQGLVFVFLPALLLGGAVGLVRLVGGRWLWWAASGLVLLNGLLFCLAPEHPLGPTGPRLLTRAALVNTDRYYLERFAAIRDGFPPAHTAIAAVNWHHLEYYLPEYALLRFDQGPPNTPRALTPRRWPGEGALTPEGLGLTPDGEGRVGLILFDGEIEALYPPRSPVEPIPLPGGGRMGVVWMEADAVLRYGEGFLEVVAR